MPSTAVSERFQSHEHAADIVVVGAGPAGICAAIAAARSGAKVLLVTDRPVLGGSASIEVGVPMNGSAYSPFNMWSRETGIVEEIRNLHAGCWSGQADSYWTAMDRVYWDLVHAEPNLSVLLNTSVFAAELASDKNILRIHGLQLRAENVHHISGRVFIDCSGDGTLGALAGAACRQGREARGEFNESLAPEIADSRTMGTTLLWRSRDIGQEAPYSKPDWAIDVSQLPPFAKPGSDMTRDVGRVCVGGFHGLWWAEFGGQIDTLHDDQEVLLHTRKLVYGIWDWIKNSGQVANVANQELVHVATLGGKRESRRLLGPVILTENHWREQTRFEDAVCYSGWPIDVHPPRGYLDPEPGCTHVWLPGPSDIPLRALFSMNVPNLFMAGRCFSATHVGIGSPRVIATTAACGQAAGTAAALCVELNLAPSKLQQLDIYKLQQRLLRMDQGILGQVLDEQHDLARQADITASSTRILEQTKGQALLATDPPSMPDLPGAILHEPGIWHTGSAGVVVAIPAEGAIDYVDLLLKGQAGSDVTCDLYFADRPENYRLHTKVATLAAKIGQDGWTRFAINKAPDDRAKLLLHLPPQAGVALVVDPTITPGMLATRIWDRPGESLCDHEYSRTISTPCVRVSPVQDVYRPANVVDGYIMPLGLPHQWSSAPMQAGKPEWLRLKWTQPVQISQVELVFDTQLNAESRGVAKTLVKQYQLVASTADGELILADVTNNCRRFMKHQFEPVLAQGLELRILSTCGAPNAAVYAVRVY